MQSDEVFKVRGGTVDYGKEYEQAVVANIALNLTIDDAVETFKLSSNDDDFGSFDDVVLDVTTVTGTEHFAVQLKHLDNNKSKGLWKTELSKSKGNFSLQKYFDTYKELLDENRINYKCVLFTNIDFPFDDNEQLDVKIGSDTFTLKICESAVDSLLFTSIKSSKCHKFEICSFGKAIESHLKAYENFFEHFFIYSKQGSVHQVKDEISKSMKLIIPIDNKYMLKYLEFIGEWAKQKGEKSKLTKNIMQNVFTLNFLWDNIHPIDFQNNSNLHLFQKVISKFDYSIFNKEVLKSVQSIWSNLNSNPIDKKFIKTYQLHKTENHLKTSILFWLTQQSPLIIDSSEDTIKVIETFKPSYCVLIQSEPQIALPPNITTYFQNLSDVEKHAGLYAELTKTLKCTISEESLSLESLISYDENLKKTVTTNDLLKMAVGQYTIKDLDNHKFLTPYIPRFFKQNFINLKPLTDDLRSKNFFFISNVKNETQIQQFVSSREANKEKFVTKTNVQFITKNVCFTKLKEAAEQFSELTKTHKNYKEYHHLRFVENKNLLQWVESVNGISDIRQFIIHGHSLNEDTFCEKIETGKNVKLICDDPGMGKTWLLHFLKNKLASKFWTVFLSSAEIDEFCNQSPKPKTKADLIEFLLNTKYNKHDSTEKIIIRIVLNTQKTAYFWDAFDEIEPYQVDIITNIIKNISSLDKDSIHFVTSRKYLKKSLEEEFCVLSQSLSQFGVQEQKAYLEKGLSCDENEKEILTEKLLQYFNFIKENDFLGIPLQIYMLTELFQSDPNEYSKLFLTKQLVVTDLYNYFFEEKLKVSYKNNANKNPQSNLDKKEFYIKRTLNYACYQKLSLILLFDTDSITKMNINKEDVFSSLSDDIQLFGLIQKDVQWKFIHNSYAEYFAARFFVDNIEKLREIKDIWFNAENNNVRFFFDLMMAKNSPPHLAVLYQNYDILKSCKDLKNCKDDGGRTLLHLACSWGDRYSILNVKIVQKWFQKRYIIDDRNVQTGKKNYSYFEMLNYLLKNVMLEQKDDLFKMTEIDYATSSSSLLTAAAVKKALNKNIFDLSNPGYALSLLYYTVSLGYDAFLRDQVNLDFIDKTELESNIFTLIHLASRKGHIHTLKLLLKHAPIRVNKDKVTPLYWACKNGHVKTAELLLKHGADCNAAHKNGFTPLYVACQNGHVETVELLMAHGVDYNTADNEGTTPLYMACQNGHVKIVELLLKHGVDNNAADNEGTTPLYIACQNGHVKTVELLLEQGTDYNAGDNEARTPLYGASFDGHVKIVELLLKQGADYNTVDIEGMTPLIAASGNGHVETVELLLKHGADYSATHKDGFTPLYVACAYGHVETVKLLLEHGVDCNAADNEGTTPLFMACESGHMKTVELLLAHGADCNAADNEGTTPLYIASENGHVKTVKLLLEHGVDYNAADNEGRTPLWVASFDGHVETVELLLKHGADYNAANKNGATPLYIACQNGQVETVELLLKHGVDFDAADNEGTTPLHMACQNGHVKTVELLLKQGADCKTTNKYGITLFRVASEKRYSEIESLLIKHMLAKKL